MQAGGSQEFWKSGYCKELLVLYLQTSICNNHHFGCSFVLTQMEVLLQCVSLADQDPDSTSLHASRLARRQPCESFCYFNIAAALKEDAASVSTLTLPPPAAARETLVLTRSSWGWRVRKRPRRRNRKSHS